ncbi:hypothetical protein ACGFK1_30685 [Mycobacterium sp. NPDC048908]|uniref:hypothetical protein n=1 Tax=Mycobacterium sp. NPDC048908 TaxID=3364292 RepID=UPI003715F3CD
MTEPEGRRPLTDQRQPTTAPGRPVDVDTGFWLWVAALPLMVTGYVVDLFATPGDHPRAIVYAVSLVFVLVASAIVVTFLILMRQGYRWARTLLTGGGIASVVYTASNLFGVDRPTAPAIMYAVAAIVGSVLIVGGVFLLHRKDAHTFFTR